MRKKLDFHTLRVLISAAAVLALLACGGDGGGGSADAADDTSVSDLGGGDTADAGGGDVIDGDTSDTGAEVGDDVVEDSPPDVVSDVGPDTFFDPDIPPISDTGTAGPLGVLSIDPDRGPTDGGTQVLVFGYGFTVDTDVLINGRRSDHVDFVDDETLLARVPANPAGIYDVKVANGGAEAALVQGFTYFAALAPAGVEPSAGPERGGVPLVVTGAGFTDDALVSVGGRVGIDVRVVSPTRIELVAPPGVAGAADVRVTNENGTEVLAGAFTYYAEPRLDRVEPAAGLTTGGGAVVLSGYGFGTTPAVFFGSARATVTRAADGEVAVVAPAGRAGAVDVTVSTEHGASTRTNGFVYVAADATTLAIAGVVPSSGGELGGYRATVAGALVDEATAVRFGSADATIVSRSPGGVVVEVPAGTPGVVDVSVDARGDTATAVGAFTYRTSLAVTAVEPAEGDVAGGETVVVRGAGFTSDTEVRFGPVSAAGVTLVSSSELRVVTPPGTVGPSDVTVTTVTDEASLVGGYTYVEEVVVSSIAPTRGSIAGGTRVVVRGRGFYGDVSVSFGDVEATSVEIVDAATLVVRTPRAVDPERVAVTVVANGVEVRTGKNFVYFDPYSPAGGWWGDEIAGSVNATVFDGDNGERIEGAYVTLNVRVGGTIFACVTNDEGQCTISEPGVRGEQTVSASAVGYSSVTITDVDAENIMIALTSTTPPTPGTPPAGELPVIFGELSGLDKITDPGEDEQIIGVLRTSTPGVGGRNPTGTGFVQVNWIEGDAPIPYEMFSRMGELAVVAMCGVFNTRTGDFRPLWMGLHRGIAARGGERYEVNLECDIPLDLTMTFKFTNSPIGPRGPDINVAIPYLDFGGEGAIDFMHTAEGTSDVVSAPNFARLTAPGLEGVDYEVVGQAVPTDGGLPFAIAYGRDITRPEDRVNLPTMVPPADLVYPAPGGTVVERRFEWRLATDAAPDFYYAYIQDTAQETTFWEVWLPGDQTGFNLPYFPPGAPAGVLPTGSLVLIVLAIDAYTFDYDAFEFNDFGSWNWKSYSAAGWLFINP
ncbi:MAG: IPT/TIG domain-containing protein [Myxococcales bacterium]|nr:IPT/TIG domain-containing protein [Myxococcales bacterium]